MSKLLIITTENNTYVTNTQMNKIYCVGNNLELNNGNIVKQIISCNNFIVILTLQGILTLHGIYYYPNYDNDLPYDKIIYSKIKSTNIKYIIGQFDNSFFGTISKNNELIFYNISIIDDEILMTKK